MKTIIRNEIVYLSYKWIKEETEYIKCRRLPHYCFLITCRYQGKKLTFTYHDSFVNWSLGKVDLSKDNMKIALECLLSDARIYERSSSYEHFCMTFGYDGNEGKKSYNGCKQAFKSVQRVFGSEWRDFLSSLHY